LDDQESHHFSLLTVGEMARADALTIAGGIPGITLMENAGAAVAAAVTGLCPAGPVAVLCGPGNNGGDGFVAARLLAALGRPVRLALLGDRARLRGDAALAAGRWPGPVSALTCETLPELLKDAPVVIDALFGAGLTRPLDGVARVAVEAMRHAGGPVVAVDVPSGIDGDTGMVCGAAPVAAVTVTFFRKKPGHLLLPGRTHCGRLVVADIGIGSGVFDQVRPSAFENHPALWRPMWPWPRIDDHKYRRGHAVIVGGARMTGAARLATRAAQRVGAGLVSVLCPPAAFPIYAGSLASALIEPVGDHAGFTASLADLRRADPRRTAVLIGPGAGLSAETRERTLAVVAGGRACVIDADALTGFADTPALLRDRLHGRCVLTPHDGEFSRLFPELGSGVGGDSGPAPPGCDRLTRARAAAAATGAVVVLKGPDTVIAAADGNAVINANAPPTLAVAGSGDVLAGLLVGLLVQGMPAFAAAAAAVWLHGAAAARFGPGLIAEDLAEQVPALLRTLAGGDDDRGLHLHPPVPV